MSFTDEYLDLRKKKKKNENPVENIAPLYTNKTAAFFNKDIAPLVTKPTKTTKTTAKKDEDERTWFKSSEFFDDGYDFGDVTKTILGTARDVGENIVTGVVGMGEKILDASMMLGAAMNEGKMMEAANNEIVYNALTGKKTSAEKTLATYQGWQEDVKQGAADFVKQDLYDEEEVTKKILFSDPITNLTGIDPEAHSVLGEKSDALVQSAGQLAAQYGLQAVGVPWFVTSGMTSFGSEAENALNQGATFEEANLSATITAGAEILTEKLFGGDLFTKGAGSDLATKYLATAISNKTVRTLAKLGIDTAGEGFEEVASQAIGNLGTSLYKEKNLGEILFSEEALDEYVESFIGGSVLGGGMGSINAVVSNKKGVDYATGLTKNEQAVVEKVYNDALAEEEKGGKVTAKRKAEIYDEVLEQMEKGYISTDTIEEVLGDKSSYDSLAKESEEFDTLYNTASGQLSKAQQDRLAELEAKNKENPYKDALKTAKEQHSQGIFELVKGDRLVESYNERAKRSQAFEADLTQYDAKQQETIKKAAESGILNNTRRTHEFVDLVARISADKSVLFDFTSNEKLKESVFAVDGKTVNGYFDRTSSTIGVNIDSSKALNSVVGHEITHVLEGTDVYNVLQQTLFDYAKSKGEYDSRLASLTEMYKGVKDADVNAELTADLVGDYLFTDKDFVRKLSTENRNVFQKLYDEIKYLCKVATAGSKEAKELEKVKKAFADAYRAEGKASGDTKYSISETTDGRLVAVVDNDILSNIDTTFWDDTKKAEAKKAAADALKQFSEGIVVDGITRKVNKVSRREYTRSNYTEKLYKQSPDIFADKMRAADVADDIVVAATNWNRDGGLKHPRSDDFVDFDHGKTLIASRNSKYIAEVVVGITDTGEAVLYDVVDMQPTTFDIKKEESPTTATTQNAIGDIQGDSSAANVAQKDSGVKGQFSLSDSAGKQLSEEQQDYFKDSKIRDENGNLKVMYHGSPESFTVFDRKKAKASGYYGKGFYFTDSDSHAGQYGNTYEVYLNITNPLKDGTNDITKEQLRKFVEAIADNEDYGIENYGYGATVDSVTDSVYGKSDFAMLMDINASCVGNMVEAIELFNEVNGTDYNGIIAPTETVAFYHNQIKNVDNASPTSDPDIRFSLSESVEETKDLIALHNMQSSELIKTLELGGLPMPSVAIIKAEAGHEQYGDVSLILPKETIDPKTSRNNKVYGGDAWTPTYPKIEYKPNERVAKRIRDKYYGLAKEIGYDAVRPMYSYVNELEDTLNRSRGEAAMLENLYEDTDMMNVYLQDSGKGKVDPITKEIVSKISEAEAEMYQFFIDALGADKIAELYVPKGDNPLPIWRGFVEKHESEIRDVYRRLFTEVYEFTDVEADNALDDTSRRGLEKIMRDVYRYSQNSGVSVRTETDYEATRQAIREASKDGYREWVDSLFKGVESKSGIRNNQDYYTRSGNPRSWDALHWENTLENVVKVMRQQTEKGADTFFGGTGIWAVSAKDYSSIEEVKADSHRLRKMSEEEYEAVKDSYAQRFNKIAENIADKSESNWFIAQDNAMEAVVDAVRNSKTKAGILNELKQYRQLNVTEADVDDIVSLVSDIAEMPTGYFEAKPRRAVGLDEVGVFVIPRNADVKLKQELLNRGYSIAEYDPEVEGDRQKVVNQFEEYKFSLSNIGEAPKTYGNYNVSGKDIALETEQENIAPVAEENTATQEVVAPVPETNLFPDNLAPMEESEAEAQERLASLDDSDAPPIPAESYPGESTDVTVDDPFEDRDWYEVGNRKVKAYMYENPDVKPFFQEEAMALMGELNDTTKGERWYNDEVYYESGGEKGFGGTKRHTSASMEELLDSWGMSYADIEKGLNAIIEDNGAENIAAAKKIEFMLNDRLLNGYKDFYSNGYIPPNQDYINLLNEKQITEYSKEAFDSFMATADQYAPPEIAPTVSESKVAPIAENPAAVAYEAIRPKQQKEPRMARATSAEQARAEILTEEPKVEKKKNGFRSKVNNLILDKGMIFEDLSLATGNRELQARWNSIRYAEGKAQKLIGEGNASVDSLKSIQERVDKSGKTKQFYEYLYHMHNVDRMTLEERFEDTPNKAVFGDSVTADISRDAADKLAKANPEFAQWAEDVYSFNKYLRELLVEGGVISSETAQLWEEMYPHYVPIRRAGDTGLNINVPLDTGRTGVNAPIKRATGGSSDILPLFDTMGQRAIQTYKAIAKNRFGVELKNTLGTTIENESLDVDEAIDSIDAQDGLLQEGKNGQKPTFTVFENGKKVTFEITDEMYDAMKPTNEIFSGTSKVLNTISNFRRGTLTEYNPWFMLKNAVKDIQDVLINSQHAARTYLSIPSAIKQMTTNGHWYQEYLENGGEQNTYFDNETNTFAEKNKALEIAKKVTGLDAISKANNIIERLPRLAEYIASRKAGRSIDVSMLDASRVTTNFAAGGEATKWLNRNGATFLNASVQGAMQQARNIREAKANGLKGWASLAAKYTLAGLPAVLLNHLLWDDDEEYEELSDYVKENYYIVGKYGDGKFVRIPKGRTVAVIQNAFEQMENLITGDDEVDLGRFLDLVVTNLAPNNPLDNNIISPIVQVANNETWYGEDLVPTRLQDLPAAEQYDESTDSISRWLGETFNISPVKANYLLDQYSGVIGDTFLPMLTPEAESGDNSFAGNMIAPLKDMFSTDSVMNNQNVSDFYDTMDELATNAKASTATDEDVLKYKYINSVNADLSELYAQKRALQSSDLADDRKYQQVRKLQAQIDALAKKSLATYENVNIDNGYATVGDLHFRWYTPGEDSSAEPGWQKISDKQLDKQEKVTSALGISGSEYWSNKEEYDYAYDNPEKTAVAKAVGGYDAFKTYSSDLYDIKADKDSSGKSISGSRKEKVEAYINGLDADYGEKIILFKSEYPADDTYNYEIIDYLNNRDDISYDEIVTILKELGFTVSSNGTITWD